MPRSASIKSKRKTRKRPLRALKWFRNVVPKASTRRRWWKKYRGTSPVTQVLIGAAAIVCAWLALNFFYQVARKPTELFFPVSNVLSKSPAETWDDYAPIFKLHSTAIMSPELLAALAQVEGSGNPIVRTYWRWSLTKKPFEVYKPASSAVGMMQITDGTFEEGKQFCIHNHRVVADGPWHQWSSCWFNSLYFRVVPSHAVEITSAYLDRQVADILARRREGSISLQQKQTLATLIHLCGRGAGESYARRGFQLLPSQRCGDHSAASYVARVNVMKLQFEKLAAHDRED